MKPLDRGQVFAVVRERADSDPAFRVRLLTDPAAAISEVVEVPVPDSLRITVHEESPTDIHLVIPVSSDLSEEDLELVAGGHSWSFGCA